MPPPLELIPSGSTIDLAERRLAARDKVIMIEEIAASLGKSPYALFYSLMDDTHYRCGERHVYFLCYFDVDKGTPVARLVSLKPTPGKDAATNANEDMINIASIKADVARHGGSCTDHAAVAEGKSLGKLVIAKAKEEATKPQEGGYGRSRGRVASQRGPHKSSHPTRRSLPILHSRWQKTPTFGVRGMLS